MHDIHHWPIYLYFTKYILFKYLLYLAFIKVSLIMYVDLKLFFCVCIELEYALNSKINLQNKQGFHENLCH